MISGRAIDAIEASDTDELLRVVDGYCAAKEWEALVELRARCREAVGRGKQLWGVEEHIRYRLALEAPGLWAGPVLSEGPARFALGPLPEVAASTKTWADLDQYLDHGPGRATFAAERVIRGEGGIGPIPDLPDRLLDWEPNYPTAVYKADRIEAPSPKPPRGNDSGLPQPAQQVADPESEAAMADLVRPWVEESNGRCQTVTVDGAAEQAVRALGPSRASLAELEGREALAWMAWAGASGGAHGRRRGAAAGRYGAWWVVATLSDLDWPPVPDQVKESLQRLRWLWFHDGSPGTGWELRLAIEDPSTGLAWAVSAVDAADS